MTLSHDVTHETHHGGRYQVHCDSVVDVASVGDDGSAPVPYAELLHPRWSSHVSNCIAAHCPANASSLTSSTVPTLVFLLMSTPKSLSIETAASLDDVPFT